MNTQILEGTFSEVQRRLSALPLDPEAQLRVVVTETDQDSSSQMLDLNTAPRRNGLILLPTKQPDRIVTVELVNSLRDD